MFYPVCGSVASQMTRMMVVQCDDVIGGFMLCLIRYWNCDHEYGPGLPVYIRHVAMA